MGRIAPLALSLILSVPIIAVAFELRAPVLKGHFQEIAELETLRSSASLQMTRRYVATSGGRFDAIIKGLGIEAHHELEKIQRLALLAIIYERRQWISKRDDCLAAIGQALNSQATESARYNQNISDLETLFSRFNLEQLMVLLRAEIGSPVSSQNMGENASRLLKIGDEHFAAGRPKTAILFHKTFLAKGPAARDDIRRMADGYIAIGELHAAIILYRVALQGVQFNSPDAAFFLLQIASLYEKLGHWDEALRTLSKVSRSYPGTAWAEEALLAAGKVSYQAANLWINSDRVSELANAREYGRISVSVLKEFIDKYPESHSRPQALFLLVKNFHYILKDPSARQEHVNVLKAKFPKSEEVRLCQLLEIGF